MNMITDFALSMEVSASDVPVHSRADHEIHA